MVMNPVLDIDLVTPRVAVYFWVVHLDESESMAADFVEVEQGRDTPGPYLIGGFPIQGGR